MNGNPPKRILIVNQNWMGDVLFSTPALRAVRKKFPESFIACLVPPRCEAVLRNNPHLNEVMLADDRAPFLSLWATARIVGAIRKRHFDKAIFFHRSKTKVLWTLLAGVPERTGYAGSALRSRWLTRAVARPEKPPHKVDYFLNLIGRDGIAPDGRTLDFYPDPAAEARLRMLLKEEGVDPDSPYAVLHAGGNWELKRWPVASFVRWIGLFLKEFPWPVILCGTSAEEKISNAIRSPFPPGRVVSLSGKTSVDTLALLLKNARVVLSNDSGPIHLAASQNARIVGLFGPTDPALTGPVTSAPAVILRKDVGCELPCTFRACDHRVCMDWITPEEVFERTKELLK